MQASPEQIADLIFRLRKRAEIRLQIPTRKSVQEGSPDRIAGLLLEAAEVLEQLNGKERMQVIPGLLGEG